MLERIWHRNQAILGSIVRAVLIDPSGVKDVLQEAFAKLLRSGKSFATEQETYNYVRRVVLNTAIDHLRTAKRQTARFVHSETALSSASQKDPCPLTLLIREERECLKKLVLKEVGDSLRDLSPQQQEAVDILFNRNHKKIKELCQERGIPYSTLRSRALSAINQIRSRLIANGLYQALREANRK